jgi:hypothetical protein
MKFALPGAPLVFPAVGSYPITDIALTCVTFACAEHFAPDVLVPVAGELSVGAVPEPETGILLVFSVMTVACLFVAKAKLFRPPILAEELSNQPYAVSSARMPTGPQ